MTDSQNLEVLWSEAWADASVEFQRAEDAFIGKLIEFPWIEYVYEEIVGSDDGARAAILNNRLLSYIQQLVEDVVVVPVRVLARITLERITLPKVFKTRVLSMDKALKLFLDEFLDIAVSIALGNLPILYFVGKDLKKLATGFRFISTFDEHAGQALVKSKVIKLIMLIAKVIAIIVLGFATLIIIYEMVGRYNDPLQEERLLSFALPQDSRRKVIRDSGPREVRINEKPGPDRKAK